MVIASLNLELHPSKRTQVLLFSESSTLNLHLFTLFLIDLDQPLNTKRVYENLVE
jgi:hypothetical protein